MNHLRTITSIVAVACVFAACGEGATRDRSTQPDPDEPIDAPAAVTISSSTAPITPGLSEATDPEKPVVNHAALVVFIGQPIVFDATQRSGCAAVAAWTVDFAEVTDLLPDDTPTRFDNPEFRTWRDTHWLYLSGEVELVDPVAAAACGEAKMSSRSFDLYTDGDLVLASGGVDDPPVDQQSPLPAEGPMDFSLYWSIPDAATEFRLEVLNPDGPNFVARTFTLPARAPSTLRDS